MRCERSNFCELSENGYKLVRIESTPASVCCSVVLLSVLLSGCGKGLSDEQLQKVTVNAASSASATTTDLIKPVPLTASAPALLPEDTNNVAAEEGDAPRQVHEFNPADFPDACNDYVDAVSQCIDVMNKSGLEGTASLQMQLDEMQASWLKETDKSTLNNTCSSALLDIDPALRDLGC